MQKIMISAIHTGMQFSQALYLDDGENEFIPAGVAVSDDTLLLLKNKGYEFLFTDGELIKNEDNETDDETKDAEQQPVPEQASPTSSNFLASLKNTEAYTEYVILVQNCQKFFNSVQNRERLTIAPVSKVMRNLTVLVEAHPELCVAMILENDIVGFEMGKSAIDVASLSYLVAQYLQLTADKIEEITIAALLHDIGMLRINSDIITKKEKLNDAEKQTIEAHTTYGYNCLVNELMLPQRLAKIVLQHHEWYDGSGYPGHLVADEIDIGARIVACADSFTAMTSQKSYRKAMLGYDAMKTLLNDNGTHFDPIIVNALIRSIGIYPIGSIVMLSDNSLCRVIKSIPEFPLRPQLRLLIDSTGTVYGDDENKIINLQLQKNVFITQAIDPALVDLSNLQV